MKFNDNDFVSLNPKFRAHPSNMFLVKTLMLLVLLFGNWIEVHVRRKNSSSACSLCRDMAECNFCPYVVATLLSVVAVSVMVGIIVKLQKRNLIIMISFEHLDEIQS